jgi:hypothetical protein
MMGSEEREKRKLNKEADDDGRIGGTAGERPSIDRELLCEL